MASSNVDMCSLEEDEDCSELFITQESKDNEMNVVQEDGGYFDFLNSCQFGVCATNFKSPCVTFTEGRALQMAHYSDISNDDGVFEEAEEVRYVTIVTSYFIIY